MVSPYPSLPTQPGFGKTTPPRVPAWPGRGLGVPGAVAGLKGCHFQCDQTGMHVTCQSPAHQLPWWDELQLLRPAAQPWPAAALLLARTCMCESVASLEGVCLMPHQKALGTSEQRLQRQLATEASSAPASGAGSVCQAVLRLPHTSTMKLGARCRGQRGNGKGLPCVSIPCPTRTLATLPMFTATNWGP